MVRLGVMVVALSVVLAACSDGSDPNTTEEASEGGETTTTSTEAPTTPDSQASSTTVAATTTVAPSTTVDPLTGTFENPVQGGEFAQVGDWKVRVIEVTPDAADIILGENSFNDSPVAGNQFFMVTLEAEYVGSESGTFWADLAWKAVGPSAVAYEAWEATCGVIPDGMNDAGEAFPSGVIAGNVCWSVSADDAADLVMLLDNTFSFDDDARTVYDLDADMTPVEPGEGASVDLSQIPAVEISEFAQVGDWKVRVIEVTPDATEIVMDENSYNEPPAEGNQFLLATLEAEYVGDESGNFWVDLSWKAVGPSAVAYEQGVASCGVFPDSIGDAGETFPGGTITGDVCWSVSADDAADLVMLLDNTFSFDDDARTFYRLTSAASE